MLKHKSKGQGLVEFALILPILLMLLLGIFEVGRVIWAYITVQAAARDAARYAITGKPYVNSPLLGSADNPACKTINGEDTATKPWRCSPEARAEAIKEVAIERGNALIGNGAIPPHCSGSGGGGSCVCDYPQEPKYGYDSTWNCEAAINVFGVQVVGQTTDSLGRPLPRGNYAGDPGLNMVVYTFYNVKMVTPIFDAIAGGAPITVRGEVQMQNEGQNEPLENNGGGAPITIRPPITGPGTKNQCVLPAICGPNGQAIKSASGYGTFPLGTESIIIDLLNHDQSQKYDIYLEATDGSGTQYRICSNTTTDGNNNFEGPCDLKGITKAGDYCLFSAIAGVAGQTCKNPLAKADQNVKIGGNNSTTSSIVIRDNNGESKVNDKIIWAQHSQIEAILQNYQQGTYDVYVVMTGTTGITEVRLNSVPVAVDSSGFASTAPPMQRLLPLTDENTIPKLPCPPTGTNACILESRSINPSGLISHTAFYINQPELKLLDGTDYQKGETLSVQLLNHTPNRDYWVVVFTNTVTNTQIFAKQVAKTDDDGKSNQIGIPLNDNVLNNKTIVWDDGTYYIRTYPNPPDITETALETTWIAPKQEITLNTTNSCYMTIKGVSKNNYQFPIGTLINIELRKHPEGNYYIQFGNDTYGTKRIPTNRANGTVSVGPEGTATQSFIIPLTTTVTGAGTKYIISSVSTNVTQNPAAIKDACASIEILVLPKPYIQVYENGIQVDDPDANFDIPSTYPPENKAVLPDADITIRLRNHAPNTNYELSYAGNKMGFNRDIQVDNNGSIDVFYDLADLPPSPGFNIRDSKNWGVPLYLYSYQNGVRIATTTLTIRSADLWAREANPAPVQVVHTSSDPHINRPYTVTFTIQNTATIAISRNFDIDMYQNPTPLIPGQVNGAFNLPGDYKEWRTTPLASQEEFTIQQPFTLTHYGVQTFYAYANTSGFVNEVTKSNNVVSTSVNLICNDAPTGITPETFGLGTQTEVAGPEVNFNSPYALNGGSGGANDSEWRGIKQWNSGGTYETSQGKLFLIHGGGSLAPVNGNDRLYALYYNSPITRLASAQITIDKAPTTEHAKSIELYGVGTTSAGWAGLEIRAASADATRDTDKRVYFALRWSDLPSDQNYSFVAGGRIVPKDAANVAESKLPTPKITKNDLPVTLKIEVDTQQKFHFKYGLKGAAPTIEISSFSTALNGLAFTPSEAQALYVTLLASNTDDNTKDYFNAKQTSVTVFDDFKTTVWSEGGKFAGANWEAQPYGGKTTDPILGTTIPALVLKNAGGDNIGSRNDHNNGYFFYRYKNPTPISTKFDFEAILGIHSLSGAGEKAMAGLEVRREVDGKSAKIQFGLASVGNGKYVPRVINRATYNGASSIWLTNTTQYQFPSYVWLRIKRNQTTGGFQFFHAQTANNIPPTSWTAYSASELVVNAASSYEPIDDEVQVGLFNDSQNSSVVQSAEYVYFSFNYRPCEPGQGDSDTIQTAAGPVPTNIPPGFKYCPSPLLDNGLSFERPGALTVWSRGGNATIVGGGAHEGDYKISNPTNLNGNNPYFYQKLTLENPPPVSNTAEVNFSIWRDINDLGQAEKTDTFLVALVTKPPLGSYPNPTDDELLTFPTEIANGQMEQLFYEKPKWQQINVSLQVKPGINLNSYTGDVYLLVYNNSNGTNCKAFGNCHATEFYFDDINLEICRTQPRPTSQELLDAGKPDTQINGYVTINTQTKGGITIREPAEGVKVWAYSEAGELFETTTIQGGEYNFYGLPATPDGTKYFIYSEASVDGGDETIVVAGNVNTILTLNSTPKVTGINIVLVDFERLAKTN